MPPKTAFRLLVMMACIAGIAYGSTRIDDLPTGPRKVLARIGRWIQDKAMPTESSTPQPKSMPPVAAAAHAVPTSAVAVETPVDMASARLGFSPQPIAPAVYEAPIASQATPPAPFQSADPDGGMARQLQALGATRCELEKWGDTGRFYRFQCELSVASQPDLRQRFEAVAETDAEAIRRVLEQVRQSQVARNGLQ